MPPTDKGRATFTVQLGDIQFADSGAGSGQLTVRGHASVFNRLSHDLGGFRTKIAPGAFTKILDQNPDVHLVIDHDTRYTLARTKNKTLELREDPHGLHMWARMAPTSYAKDLAILMERGDVDQMSFACDIADDTWTEDSEGITRTINEVSALYDVTICAQGAFPQTDSQLVASVHDASDILASAIEAGRVQGRATSDDAAPEEFTREDTEGESTAQNEGASTVAAGDRHAEMRADALARYDLLKASLPK